MSYPIAVPREQSRWSGVTTVTMKKENPAWTPTPEMIRENPRLPRWVPGGHPMNPFGVRGMYLGSSTYRIHGTDAPWTIGQAVSKGCIRMLNEDVLDLYPKVPVGTKVTVTWNRFNSESVASNDPAERRPAVRRAPHHPISQAVDALLLTTRTPRRSGVRRSRDMMPSGGVILHRSSASCPPLICQSTRATRRSPKPVMAASRQRSLAIASDRRPPTTSFGARLMRLKHRRAHDCERSYVETCRGWPPVMRWRA